MKNIHFCIDLSEFDGDLGEISDLANKIKDLIESNKEELLPLGEEGCDPPDLIVSRVEVIYDIN